MSAMTPKICSTNFTWKLVIACVVVITGVGLVSQPDMSLNIIGVFLLGSMYAHAVELQHQCLHNTAFKSRQMNRIVGVCLGLPLLSSFHAYRRLHLEHHRTLGTPNDKTFYTYRFTQHPSISSFLHDFLGIAHLKGVFASIFGQSPSKLQVQNMDFAEDITGERFDYGLMVFALGLTYLLAMNTGSLFLVKVWIIPMLIVGQPLHFLIELPEHIGCSKASTDSFYNTRTIQGSRFSTWFTNGNNFHVEHHLAPALSMDQMRDLFEINKGNHIHFCSSYFEFYKMVFKISGESHKSVDKGSLKRRPT